MAREPVGWKPRVSEPPLDHPEHVIFRHAVLAKLRRASDCRAEEGSILGSVAGGDEILADKSLKVVACRDVADLAAFFVEPKNRLAAVRVEVATPKLRDCSGSNGRVNHHAYDGPVAEPDNRSGVDAREHLAGLLDRQGRRLALGHAVLRSSDRKCRIEHNRVPLNELVEEFADAREVELFHRLRRGPMSLWLAAANLDLGLKSFEVAAHDSRRHFVQRDPERLAVLQEPMHRVPVGSLRVRVLLAREKLVVGEMGVAPGEPDNSRWLVLA